MTGATSPLGRRVCAALGQRRLRYRALVRPGSPTRILDRLGAWIVEGDLTDPASLVVAFDGVEQVLHLAPPALRPSLDGVGFVLGAPPDDRPWITAPALLACDLPPGTELLARSGWVPGRAPTVGPLVPIAAVMAALLDALDGPAVSPTPTHVDGAELLRAVRDARGKAVGLRSVPSAASRALADGLLADAARFGQPGAADRR